MRVGKKDVPLFPCCGLKPDTGHSHGSLPNDPQRHPPKPPFLNVGIYLAEDKTVVGLIPYHDKLDDPLESKYETHSYKRHQPSRCTMVLPDDLNVMNLLEMASEITFLDERIVLGSHTDSPGSQRDNHFRLYDLIKETSDSSPIAVIRLNAMYLTLTKEEILALFFEKLLREIQSAERIRNIDNVVITLPFTVTSLEKEKIKVAATAGGFPQVRILSSVLTTGIAFAVEKSFFEAVGDGNPVEPKTVFIAQYQRASFTMAIIELGQGYIYIKKKISSDQMKECQDPAFKEYHQEIYEHNHCTKEGIVKSEKTYYIFKIYKSAIEKICTKEMIETLSPVIVKNEEESEKKCSLLDNNFLSVFRQDVLCTFIPSGPLAGACYLAARFVLPKSSLPPSIIICDGNFSNIVWSSTSTLFYNWRKGQMEKSTNFCPGLLFEKQVSLSPHKDNNIVLNEEFLPNNLQVVAQYLVSVGLKEEKLSGHVLAKMLCRVDQNGIFGLGFVFPPGVVGSVHRITGPCISGYSYAGYSVLRAYYQALLFISTKSGMSDGNSVVPGNSSTLSESNSSSDEIEDETGNSDC